jgi:hypothetical protein
LWGGLCGRWRTGFPVRGGHKARSYVHSLLLMPTNRLVLVFAFLTLLMGGLALYFGVLVGRQKSELALARRQVLERDRMLFRQDRGTSTAPNPPAEPVDLDTIKVEEPAAAVFADELGSLTGDELSDLMKAGLPADPEAFLEKDLRRQADDLSTGSNDPNATLEDIRILSPHFALASWHDGHSSGTAVVRYDVQSATQINWKVLDWGTAEVNP